jgi:hypothetical protein
MQSLLNLLSDGSSIKAQQTQAPDSNIWNLTSDLNLFANIEPWDFEFDFWASLADHPGLNIYES